MDEVGVGNKQSFFRNNPLLHVRLCFFSRALLCQTHRRHRCLTFLFASAPEVPIVVAHLTVQARIRVSAPTQKSREELLLWSPSPGLGLRFSHAPELPRNTHKQLSIVCVCVPETITSFTRSPLSKFQSPMLRLTIFSIYLKAFNLRMCQKKLYQWHSMNFSLTFSSTQKPDVLTCFTETALLWRSWVPDWSAHETKFEHIFATVCSERSVVLMSATVRRVGLLHFRTWLFFHTVLEKARARLRCDPQIARDGPTQSRHLQLHPANLVRVMLAPVDGQMGYHVMESEASDTMRWCQVSTELQPTAA